MLPTFFIAGAPKAGTTSLYHYLDQHPQIYMSAVKEPNFFAAEIREENFVTQLRGRMARDARELRQFLSGPMLQKRFGGIVTDFDDYARLFANSNGASARGEASVCYLWSSTAAEAIVRRIPDAKILVMLRDPAERAFSQYLHGIGNGTIRWSFREHIERNVRYRSRELCIHYPFLEFGWYAAQLSRFLERFGSHVWIGLHEDLKSHPMNVVQDIYRFLGVDAGFSPDIARRHLEAEIPRTAVVAWLRRSGAWRTAADVTPVRMRPRIRQALVTKPKDTRMDPADRRYLVDYYREDIRKLAGILGRELDAWLRV